MSDKTRSLRLPERELMAPGHLACQGCGAALAMRLVLKALGPRTALVIPACCWAVMPGPMPRTCLDVPTLFCAFECTAATAAGLKAGLRRAGQGDVTVVGFAGDGGTADIGLQALSGAAERGDDILYVCYDNEAYMNTGIQRSGSTPPGARTTTTPGTLRKEQPKKDMFAIMAAHGIPYAATANPSYPLDLLEKVRKAARPGGLRYLHILADCPTGWRHEPSAMVEVGKLATTSRVFPLLEVEAGVWRITKRVTRPTPVAEYLRAQGRFSDLDEDAHQAMQEAVDARWSWLEARVRESAPATSGQA